MIFVNLSQANIFPEFSESLSHLVTGAGFEPAGSSLLSEQLFCLKCGSPYHIAVFTHRWVLPGHVPVFPGCQSITPLCFMRHTKTTQPLRESLAAAFGVILIR
jgi:hypothetical protein